MARYKRVRPWRMLATTMLPLSMTDAGPAEAISASAPPLRLVAAVSSVTAQRFPGEPVFLPLGINLVAGDRPLEIHVKRASYHDPIVAEQLLGRGARKRTRRLPGELVDGFNGLKDLIRLTLTDDSGKEILDQNQTFAPVGSSVRVRPDAPPTSPYPESPGGSPFALGAVWGLQAGWAIDVLGGGIDGVELADGSYTARVRMSAPHLAFFGIPADQADVAVRVTVTTSEGEEPGEEPPLPPDDHVDDVHVHDGAHARLRDRGAPEPAAMAQAPEPAAMAQPEPAAMAQPEPAAMAQPEPAA